MNPAKAMLAVSRLSRSCPTVPLRYSTSFAVLLLMDGEGTIQNVVSREYPLEFPRPGWSQQDPEDWKAAVL